MDNAINISDFFKSQYTNYASYDNSRKIACVIDGNKISARKIIHTILQKNITKSTKVDAVQNLAASYCHYIHGAQSLYGVIVGLAQNFVGSNNIPLLQRDGTFGDRQFPEAAAGRYIYTMKEDYLDKIFIKEDEPVLEKLHFEGHKIEPKFFVPTIPMIFVNETLAITTGFFQRIYGRDPIEVINYLKKRLNGKKVKFDLMPYYKGFSGRIEKTDVNSYSFIGKVKKINTTTIEITELPPKYNLKQYIKILDKLEDNDTIRSYTDHSDADKDTYKFTIRVKRSFNDKYKTENHLLKVFRLIKNETEILTGNNENMQIVEYKNIQQIMDNYYDVKMKYMQKRKDDMIAKLTKNIKLMNSKLEFIKGVITNKILISNKSIIQIEKNLDENQKIIKIEDSYDYLINLSIRALTKEKYDTLKKIIKESKIEFKEMSKRTITEMWLKELDDLKLIVKKL